MKPTPGLVSVSLLFFLADFSICTSQPFSSQNTSKIPPVFSAGADSLPFNQPQFYAEAHVLFGGEVTNLFDNEKTVVSGTPLWKTDVRAGLSQKVTEKVTGFIFIRDDDHPQTGSFSLYEAAAKASYSWGYMLFGQTRLQAGNHSYYLNQSFDRTFWDKALIFDYVFRGARSVIQTKNTETELFFGTGQTSFFLWGSKFSLFLLDGLTTRLSGFYVARDNQYAAFGPGFGLEIEEKAGSFRGYQIIGFKNLYQDPSHIKEFTAFSEGQFSGKFFEVGSAVFFRRMEDKFRILDELRLTANAKGEIFVRMSPGVEIEFFEKLHFSEIRYGIFLELVYGEGIRMVPRFRYIIPETGPDIGFLGLECHFILGQKE